MALDAGTRLGPYEVVALIGAGGMSACGCCRARLREAAASGGGAPRALEMSH
jgi:hypothetical protein